MFSKIFKNYQQLFYNTGQSLIEAMVAVAIFSLFAASLASMILGSLSLSSEGGLITQADMLAMEGVEAVKAIKNRGWDELAYSESAIESSSGEWIFSGEGMSEQSGIFLRRIRFFPVYRDASGSICSADAPGANSDPESRELSVSVSWQSDRNTANSVEKSLLLTDWE